MIDVAFITGSSGKIGKALVANLIEKNIVVIGIGRFSEDLSISLKIFQNKKNNVNIDKSLSLNEWTICEENNLLNLLHFVKDCSIKSYFFHLAWEGASALTDGGYKNQIYNVGLSSKYLDLSKTLGAIKFINAGSVDEIYINKCMQSKNFNKMKDFEHLEYGIAKLATRDILSFKSYVENIDFIHTQTSIGISTDLKSKNFVERNLKNIVNGQGYEQPKNKELCNISTFDNIAKKLYNIALLGDNQKNYYTGTDEVYTLKYFFNAFDNLIKGTPIGLSSNQIIDDQILTYEDFEISEHLEKNNSEVKNMNLSNLLKSIQIS